MTSSTGAVIARRDYLPFGSEIQAGFGGRTAGQGYNAADDTRQKFSSKERDGESMLDYFGARYYASAQGRFTSSDPLLNSGRTEIPQSWNRYAYVLNNPILFTDPLGLYEFDKTATDDEKARFRAGYAELKKARGRSKGRL